ncbi:hypothetical protein H6786_02930 [Candidatus Nomurabacteria bacterium]|nr:hypothetical protein [Candidatus Nomurabacteria bacterium]
MGPKAPIERVSDDTYVNQWDDNQRTEYDTQMPILSDRWLKKQQTDYRAGFPVHFGEGKTAGTILRNRLLDQAAVYQGHITSEMGMEVGALIIYQTEGPDGTMKLNNGKPVVLLTQPFSQEANGRFVAKLGVQLLSALGHGAWAAEIRADSCKDGNCAGNTTLINAGGNSSAGAISGSESSAGAGVDLNFNASGGDCCGGAFSPRR